MNISIKENGKKKQEEGWTGYSSSSESDSD